MTKTFTTDEFNFAAYLMQYFSYSGYSKNTDDLTDAVVLYSVYDPTECLSTQSDIDGYLTSWRAADPSTYQTQIDLLTTYTT